MVSRMGELLALVLSFAFATSAVAQDKSEARSDKASGLPAINLIGIPEKAKKEIQEAHDAASADDRNAEKLGRLAMLYYVPAPISAAEVFHKASEADSKSFRWKYYEGLAYASAYRSDDAIAAFRAALALDDEYAALLIRLGDLTVSSDAEAAEKYYRRARDADPKDARAPFGLGTCAKKRGDAGQAVAHFKEAIALCPQFAAAHGALADVLEAEGQFQEAKAHRGERDRGTVPPPGKDHLLIELLSMASGGTELLQTAEGLAGSGQHQAAATLLQKALERAPDDVNVRHAYGVVLDKMGRTQEALRQFSEVLAVSPSQMETLIYLAQTLIHLGEYQLADSLVHEVLQADKSNLRATRLYGGLLLRMRRAEDALACFQRIVDRDPNSYDGHMGMAIALICQDKLDGALESYSKARKLQPAAADMSNRLLAHLVTLAAEQRHPTPETTRELCAPLGPASLDGLARALSVAKLTDESEALQRFPEFVVKRVAALTAAAEYDDAVRMAIAMLPPTGDVAASPVMSRLRERLSSSPSDAGMRHVLAVVMSRLGRSDEAVQLWEQAARIDPKLEVVYLSWGMDLMARGDYSKANEVIRRGMGHLPESAWLANALAWSLATAPSKELRDPVEALKLATRAVEKTQRNEPGVLDTLAAAWAASGKFKEAVQAEQDAIRLANETWRSGGVPGYKRRLQLYENEIPYIAESK